MQVPSINDEIKYISQVARYRTVVQQQAHLAPAANLKPASYSAVQCVKIVFAQCHQIMTEHEHSIQFYLMISGVGQSSKILLLL